MREGDRGKDYRLRQERRRLENGEKDLVIYKGEITTKQALQQETGTEVSDIQPQTRNQGQGNSRSRPPKGTGCGGGEIERNSCSHSVHSIHPNTNKPNSTKVKKSNTKTHTNTVSTNQPTKPFHSPTTPNPRRDTAGEKGVGERGYGGKGKGNITMKDTLNCALKMPEICVTRKKRWSVMCMKTHPICFS